MYYVLSSDDSLRVSFEQAVEKFTENLPFRYQEEKSDPNAVAEVDGRGRCFRPHGFLWSSGARLQVGDGGR